MARISVSSSSSKGPRDFASRFVIERSPRRTARRRGQRWGCTTRPHSLNSRCPNAVALGSQRPRPCTLERSRSAFAGIRTLRRPRPRSLFLSSYFALSDHLFQKRLQELLFARTHELPPKPAHFVLVECLLDRRELVEQDRRHVLVHGALADEVEDEHRAGLPQSGNASLALNDLGGGVREHRLDQEVRVLQVEPFPKSVSGSHQNRGARARHVRSDDPFPRAGGGVPRVAEGHAPVTSENEGPAPYLRSDALLERVHVPPAPGEDDHLLARRDRVRHILGHDLALARGGFHEAHLEESCGPVPRRLAQLGRNSFRPHLIAHLYVGDLAPLGGQIAIGDGEGHFMTNEGKALFQLVEIREAAGVNPAEGVFGASTMPAAKLVEPAEFPRAD